VNLTVIFGRRRASALAIRLITASTLVAAAFALPFAPTAHSEFSLTPPGPTLPCDLETTRSLLIWQHAPRVPDSTIAINATDAYNCRPALETWHSLVPNGPGYCSKIAWSADNPGSVKNVSPVAPLQKVIDEVGDC
jgi:hypothetical protein